MIIVEKPDYFVIHKLVVSLIVFLFSILEDISEFLYSVGTYVYKIRK